jgi:hypothetical protein
LDFISKTERKEALLKEGTDGLEYSKEIATVFKVVEDPTLESCIKEAYEKDVGAQRALMNETDTFKVDDTGLIRFKGVVYLFKNVRKPLVKELYKELSTKHLKTEKT